MPLNKFIPLSPDPNITKDSDMGMAQFGHLNTIVDYLNTYVAADSLQLDGTGPLSATARYITDSAGNLSSLAISTGNIGIGTTNATARLRVISADTNGIAEFFQNGNTSSPLHLTRYTGLTSINLNSAAGGSASPVPVGDGIQLSRITTNTYNGTAFAASTRIEVITKGIQSATNYGSNMRFQITPENNINLYTSLALLSDGNVQIGADYNVALGAKLGIKGSGSTSATTSLLVQNSGGNTAFQVKDNLQVDFGGIVSLTNGGVYVVLTSPSSDAFATGVLGSLNFYVRADGRTKGNRILAEDINGMGTLDNSAILQANSTNLGFLPPRMTTIQKNAIATPAIGLMVFDTTLGRPCFYNGAWVTL